MSDAMAFKFVDRLVGQCGFVLPLGRSMTGNEFADKILSAFDGGVPKVAEAVSVARKHIVSIARKRGDLIEAEWRW